jgi:FAD:protein FMN transferase
VEFLRRSFRAMAADQALSVWAADGTQTARAADAAIADVHRIEAKYSRYRDDSLTTRINRAAGGAPVPIDAETAALLRYADECHRLSGGRFDITSGVLRQVWDFRSTTPRLPTPDALARVTAMIGWAGVEWDDRAIRLPRAGMEIDFGGIGKEYAADRVATICAEHGVRHGLVNLSGDLRALGPQGDGTPWRIGIRHPRHADAAIAGFDLAAGALATSGDYERSILIDGIRYCHILDARSGMPVRYWQSISVVAPLCVVAGSCATIAMLLEEDAAAFLDSQNVIWFGVAADGTLRGPGNTTAPARK